MSAPEVTPMPAHIQPNPAPVGMIDGRPIYRTAPETTHVEIETSDDLQRGDVVIEPANAFAPAVVERGGAVVTVTEAMLAEAISEVGVPDVSVMNKYQFTVAIREHAADVFAHLRKGGDRG